MAVQPVEIGGRRISPIAAAGSALLSLPARGGPARMIPRPAPIHLTIPQAPPPAVSRAQELHGVPRARPIPQRPVRHRP
jgi:hypothetical protein